MSRGVARASAGTLTDRRRGGAQLIGGTFEGGWMADATRPEAAVQDWAASLAQVPQRLDALHASITRKARGSEMRLNTAPLVSPTLPFANVYS
jgi:hypothetical protein